MRVFFKEVQARNQMTGWAAFTANPAEPCSFAKDGTVACEGCIGLYMPGTPLELKGTYGEKSGKFVVESACIAAFTKGDTLRMFELAAPGLTELQAQKLAEMAGEDVFSFVAGDGAWEMLAGALGTNVSASTMAKVKKAVGKIREMAEQEQMLKELLSAGVGLDQAETLWKKDVTLAAIRKNPYRWLLPFGIHIRHAEAVASRQEWFHAYHPERLKGFVRYSLAAASGAGHTCVTPERLLLSVNRCLKCFGAVPAEMDWSLLNACIRMLSGSVGYHEVGGRTYVYSERIWKEETSAVNDILRLSSGGKAYKENADIRSIESELGIRYNREQEAAFAALRTGGVKILTGPPGSGKTTVIRGFLKNFGGNGHRLCATTGRASKVLADSCGEPAETVNRALGVRPFDGNVSGRDINDPFPEELVIVDEASMLGVQLLSFLLNAVRTGACLILVGDEGQLLSVEYGDVLHDLIASGCVETYRLTQVLRQGGLIYENAMRINRGDARIAPGKDFSITCCDGGDMMLGDLAANLPGDRTKFQVLCPMRGGMAGTDAVNRMLEDRTRPTVTSFGKSVYREGDKVIMTRTDYDLGYMNGDIGYVAGRREDLVTIRFSDGVKALPRQALRDMRHADAVTIHKSQGSEFREVHVCLPADASMMMTRRLLYTAITRAKEKVFLYVMDGCIEKAAGNGAEKKRTALLGERLKENMQENPFLQKSGKKLTHIKIGAEKQSLEQKRRNKLWKTF